MMDQPSQEMNRSDGERVEFTCEDGLRLVGHFWRASNADHAGNIIINPATGVLARYYHRYARFLAQHGFNVLTYDYRGIGHSRPAGLRGCGYRWRDWGELDFDAAVGFMQHRGHGDHLSVVGHSIGGFLVGLAKRGRFIERILTVGAQYAWWGDYAAKYRMHLFMKWHLAMPLLTLACGYFPGRRLGWLEDLPARVAYEWSFRKAHFERNYPLAERQIVLERMAAVSAPILAVVVADDDLGTLPAIRRTLGYYTGSERKTVLIEPMHYKRQRIGHFDLFHDRHADGFWLESLLWLRYGQNPWAAQTIDFSPGQHDTKTGASSP